MKDKLRSLKKSLNHLRKEEEDITPETVLSYVEDLCDILIEELEKK